MRTSFGKRAAELRAKRHISQSDFCQSIGESLSRISQIEHGRVSVTDTMISKYIVGLDCDGSEAHELRQLANYSNSKIEANKLGHKHSDLTARLTAFDDRISPAAAAKIREILDQELGAIAPSLFLKNLAFENSAAKRRPTRGKMPLSPSHTPKRFAELCLISEEIRSQFCGPNEKINFEKFLDFLSVNDQRFDYDIVDKLPMYVQGAYACIFGTASANVLVIEERRFLMAKQKYFFRHALMHEVSHHILHAHLLETNVECYLPPSNLAWLTELDIEKDEPESGNFEKIDTIVELEAETLATLILVPWQQMTRATETRYLCKDFGEREEFITRVRRYFKQPAVINAIKHALWDKGFRDHPFFSFG